MDMRRNLDGVYFRIGIENICFSDLTIEQQEEMMNNAPVKSLDEFNIKKKSKTGMKGYDNFLPQPKLAENHTKDNVCILAIYTLFLLFNCHVLYCCC